METPSELPEPMSKEMLAYYGDLFEEEGRLSNSASGILEFARTKEIISRHLPPPPRIVLDVGGGPGAYSRWLAGRGYQAHLIDPVLKHVRQVASREHSDHPIASINLGDARSLPLRDETYDAILLMGPMYHLTVRNDRLNALREARRVVRPGGSVFVTMVNRFASLVSGLKSGYIDDPYFAAILEQDLVDGQHRNPENQEHYFTTSYFHLPEELEAEISEAGLTLQELVAIQGPGVLATDFESRWSDPQRRNQLLQLIRKLEKERSLLGLSYHLIAVAQK